MDNRVNEIRKRIRALRLSMLEAEAVMRNQINRDEECADVAGEILLMRSAMSLLVEERMRLGDREPIIVDRLHTPRRTSARKPILARPVKRQLASMT